MSDKSMEICSDKKDTSAEETKKIQELQKKASFKILVGFPGGRQHIETLHHEHRRENGTEYGKYRDIHGMDPSGNQPIETAELAKMLSYGAHEIPARPFLEEGLEQNRKELTAAIQKEAQKLLNGGTPNWNKIGAMAVGKIQEFVRSDYYKSHVPNSKKTIEYKGSDTPLIDGGDLVNSMTFIVEK